MVKQSAVSKTMCPHCPKDCLTLEKLGDHILEHDNKDSEPVNPPKKSKGRAGKGPRGRPRILQRKRRLNKPEAIYIQIQTAAALIDSTRGALYKRLIRSQVPPGVMTRFGYRILIHKENFLKWVAGDA